MPAKDRKLANARYYQKHKERVMSRTKDYSKEHPIKGISITKYNLKALYGLTLEQVDEMLIAQDHKCDICGTSLKERKRCIDHSHTSGKVRSILCNRCNAGLWSIEDQEFLEKAIAYLEKYK